MNWRIFYENDVAADCYGCNMAKVAHQAAEMCEADNTRVSAVAVRKTPCDEWYEQGVTFSEWTGLLRVFGDTEKAIYLILDRLRDSYPVPVYYLFRDSLRDSYYPGITDAIPPEEWEEEDPAEVLRDLDDLEDALDDVSADPLDMMKALLEPEDFLQEFERKMQPFMQDAAELDPADGVSNTMEGLKKNGITARYAAAK